MVENNKTPMEKKASSIKIKGDLTYEDKVIQEIIGLSLRDVKGRLTVDGGFFANLTEKIVNTSDVTTGVDVEVGKTQVAVDLDIVAEYKVNITKLYSEMKNKISDAVKEMTGLDLVELNVNVVDVRTKSEHNKASLSLQDRIGSVADGTKDALTSSLDKQDNARVN